MATRLKPNSISAVITNLSCRCLDSRRQHPIILVPTVTYTTYCWKINNDYNNYNTPPLERTPEEICEMSKKSYESYRCDKQPFLNIPLNHLVVDELYLMLRATDNNEMLTGKLMANTTGQVS